MKKIALVFGLTIVLAACHTKKPQDKSGINDPVNITYGDVDKEVLDKNAGTATTTPKEVAKPDSAAASSCIDSTKINEDQACTMDYKPVCGCDGKTYSNECSAEKAGVTKWTEGECPGTKTENKKEKAPAKKKR